VVVTASLACLCGIVCWHKETKQKPKMAKLNFPFENQTADQDILPPPQSPTLQEIIPKGKITF